MLTEIMKVLLYALASFVISLMIHECGHVLVGLAYGWKLWLLIVGPLKLYRQTPESAVRIGVEKNILYWGGMGGTIPIRKSEDNIKTFGKILLAGPLSSVLFGIIVLGSFLLVNYDFLLMLAMMNIAIGIATLIPSKLRSGINYSDGTRYYRIRMDPVACLEEQEIFEIVENISIHGENAVTEEADCIHLLSSSDSLNRYYAFFCLYLTAKNRNDDEKAQEYRMQAEALTDIPASVKATYDFNAV